MFTFEGKHEFDFAPFALPLIEALGQLGVSAELSGRNDILVDGKKVSGCAHACVGSRAIYHGTLLFSAELSEMEGLLRYSEEKYRDRGIRSVSSRVENLSHWLSGLEVEEFMSRLREILSVGYERYAFSEEDVAAIGRLKDEKYGDPNWYRG
jgi:lipoate-protein ligase A